jgi:non-specific serine/threonine protein kinase
VEALGPASARWATVTHLPTPRREPGAALLGRRIVVAGGFDGESDADLEGYRDTVEAFDLEARRWTTLARLPTPRRGLALVATGDRVYAIGGYTADGEFSAAVERYDPAYNAWTALNWPIAPRTWTAAAAVDGDVLLIGGYNRDGFLDLVERVDPAADAVCHPPPLRRPRAWLAAVVVDGRVLTLGGEEQAGIGGAAEWIEIECQS